MPDFGQGFQFVFGADPICIQEEGFRSYEKASCLLDEIDALRRSLGWNGLFALAQSSRLAADEFPAILQTGERVLSRSEVNAGAPNVMINIENKTGQEVKQSNVGTSFNGKDYVISIVLEAARNNMGFRNALGIGR